MPMNEMDLLDNFDYKRGYEDGLKAGKIQQKIADEYLLKTTKKQHVRHVCKLSPFGKMGTSGSDYTEKLYAHLLSVQGYGLRYRRR